MDTLIRTITQTIIRATIYKGMRNQGTAVTVGLAVVAAGVTVVTMK